MAARKGTRPPNAGKGRRKGTPNKTTAAAREIFTKFLEANSDRVQGLFDRLAKRDPRGALEIIVKISEFVVPRLARTELKADPPNRAPEVRLCIFPDGGPGQANNPPRTHVIDDHIDNNDGETPNEYSTES